jgi:hypothetical protein
LGNLPEPPSNALRVVTTVLNKFDQIFRKHIAGETRRNKFLMAWKTIKTAFHDEIVSAQLPNLIVGSNNGRSAKEKEKNGSLIEPISLDSDDDNSTPVTPCSSKKRKIAEVYESSFVGSPTPTPRAKGAVVARDCE